MTRAFALLDSVRLSAVAGDTSASNLMFSAAIELNAHGHKEAAGRLFQQMRAWLALRPAGELSKPEARRELGRALYLVGALDSARSIYTTLVAEDSTRLVDRGRLGVIAAKLGDRVEAERISDALSRFRPAYTYGESDYQQAIIAAALGDKEKATRLLKAALEAGMFFSMRFHNDVDLQPLRGYPPFEAIIKPKG